MGVQRTKTETIADAWADDFGGVAVEARGVQVQLEIAEAAELRDLIDKAIDRALEWSGATKAATAAETRN
ncbi:hypothetical protein HUN58_14555 [Curtobacterium sp. Csp1]|uniref:hypothetical protein n=1 Tax=unclassified Curtobacterium TaxID=257496 RepID=UPI00159912F3|nr:MULTISPECIES: hypothetical protein [unclassified Curtobacterium]QKS20975.1 hypothetical protein HUN58_14555 [Curtobacterium sp. Csp1]